MGSADPMTGCICEPKCRRCKWINETGAAYNALEGDDDARKDLIQENLKSPMMGVDHEHTPGCPAPWGNGLGFHHG
jgi:hypothetical protein